MVKRYRLIKNFNRKCDPDVHVNVNVNGHDRGDYNSSMHFVQASLQGSKLTVTDKHVAEHSKAESWDIK